MASEHWNDHDDARCTRWRIPFQGWHLHLVQPLLPRCVVRQANFNFKSLIQHFIWFYTKTLTDDPVYLDNEELRREYLMNETGKVFVGTHHRPKGRRWVYGQFSDVALPAAQLLLEQSGLNPTERGNPVQVVRAIASIVIKQNLISHRLVNDFLII